MTNPTLRRFTTTLAAAATAMALMTASAMPVRADARGDDLARALAAIAAIAVIGSVIHDNDRRDPVASVPVHSPRRPAYRERDRRWDRRDERGRHWDRRDDRRDYRGYRGHGTIRDVRRGPTANCLIEERRHGRTYVTRVENCRPGR